MIQDLQLHGYSEKTQQCYLGAVKSLTAFFRRPPDQLGEEELRQYFLHLINVKQAARSTVTIAEPRVAILSAMETVSPKLPSTIEAAALCKMADRGQITGGLLEGPLALDNAISPEAARIKGIGGPVAGQADILVVPDLEAGNMLAKSLGFLAGADSAGIVLGARVPIVLTSRADSVHSRLASCAVAALLVSRRRQTAPVAA
jgi:phosphotransacetylase